MIASFNFASTAAAVAAAASLVAAVIADQLPAATPSVSELIAGASFSVKLFVCSRPIGQHDICRFFLVNQVDMRVSWRLITSMHKSWSLPVEEGSVVLS